MLRTEEMKKKKKKKSLMAHTLVQLVPNRNAESSAGYNVGPNCATGSCAASGHS